MYQKQSNTHTHSLTHSLTPHSTNLYKMFQIMRIGNKLCQLCYNLRERGRGRERKRDVCVWSFFFLPIINMSSNVCKSRAIKWSTHAALTAKPLQTVDFFFPSKILFSFPSSSSFLNVLIRCSCTKSKDVLTNRCMHLFLFRNNT